MPGPKRVVTGDTISRRLFVAGAAGAGITTMTAASYRRVLGANEKLGIGFIGYGLIGKRHVLDFQNQPDARLVGVAEAHRGRRDEAKSLMGSDATAHDDFRKLLDQRSVDAVIISTPDHWHALMTMLACSAGKDVYVEKPLSLFVREGRWMSDVVSRTKRVVQVGTQQRSGPHYERAKSLIQSGHLGQIVSVRMASYRNIMPGFGSPPDNDPPKDLDWDQFLGPAPARHYNANRALYHFRWFWDYSGGQMTNLGHHSLDIVHWILGANPLRVSSFGGRFALSDNGETPDTQDALFEFPAIASHSQNVPHPGWTASWSHREACGGRSGTAGLEFCGTKGSLVISRSGFTVTPDKQIPPANRVPQFTGAHPVGGPQPVEQNAPVADWTKPIVDSSGDDRDQFRRHARNFLDCIKSRATPVSDVESAHRVTTMCHLANLSLRLGRQLKWDAEKEQITDDPVANEWLIRPYRTPWDQELRALGVS